MSEAFFRDLEMPPPDHNLGVGSASHAAQTASIMRGFDELLDREHADVVVVVGDVNSTLACSLTAVKRGIPVAHVEAGLRSYDWAMPEEINRIVTDAVSSYLFTPSLDASRNLEREGRRPEDICFVGNVMIDTLLKWRDRATGNSTVLGDMGLAPGGYAVLTLHRPRNVDSATALEGLLGALAAIGSEIPVVYPVHPRSAKMLEASGLSDLARSTRGLVLKEPMGYLDFVALEAGARFVMTDSGGVQEETTFLGVPCLTLRPNTERPVTVACGTNRVVGSEPDAVVAAAKGILDGDVPDPKRQPELWDGRASERIVDVLLAREEGAA